MSISNETTIRLANKLTSAQLIELKSLLKQLIKKQELSINEIEDCIQDEHS